MRLRERLRNERGMTLIELMVAMVICAVGIMSTIVVLDMSRAAGDESEAREVLAHQAELELERAMALDWDVLGHAQAPSRSTTPGHPSSYVTTHSPARYQFDRTDTSRSEVFHVINNGAATGAVPHDGTEWNDAQSRLSGWVYRYVTRPNDDMRRIVVVATVNAPAKGKPVLVSSLVSNPQ
jgi:prepilin-type N-terminal cleavage/methylation domain-containing protein